MTGAIIVFSITRAVFQANTFKMMDAGTQLFLFLINRKASFFS